MNTPVSFEIAKLLTEKGYSQQGFPYYSKDLDFDDIELNHHYRDFYPENGYETFTAPTIAEVVMWLYDEQGIWVVVNIAIDDKWYFELYNLKDKRNAEIFINNENITDFHNSPTESYESAIEYTLKNLI